MPQSELASLLEGLLQAERTVARAIGPLLEVSPPGVRARLVQVQRIGSRNIAILAGLMHRIGAEPPAAMSGQLSEASMTPRSAHARIELLARAHAWFAQCIEHALPRIADAGIGDELRVVRESHLLNVGVSRAILLDTRYIQRKEPSCAT
jgi:hypothetical protein